MKNCFFLLTLFSFICCFCVSDVLAQTSPVSFGESQVIPLYDGTARGSQGWKYDEVYVEGKSGPQIRNVVRPTLLHFPTERPVGTAMPSVPTCVRQL